MDVFLTEAQQQFKTMVDDFACTQIAPTARAYQKNGEFPADIIRKAADAGLMGIAYPDSFGGAGRDFVSYMLAIESVSRFCASTGVIISAHSSLAIDPIFRFGTDEQKQRYLPALCSGRKIGCFCLTEPGAGSDAGSMESTAVHDGNQWVLNGKKHFITNGHEAGTAIVFALTEPDARTKGISAFIVDRATQGFCIGRSIPKLGIRSASTTEILLNHCEVPEENLLGGLNNGFAIAMQTLDGGRLGIASQALGIARACIEDSAQYARLRRQFGRPIANFQAIQWKLADMHTEYEAAWMLTYRASLMKDRNLPNTVEAAAAKLKASEAAMFCATNAVQIHGGIGYTEDCDAERYYRDAKITEIYEGTSEIMRVIIAGSMVGTRESRQTRNE